jgi:hypothetical protein
MSVPAGVTRGREAGKKGQNSGEKAAEYPRINS